MPEGLLGRILALVLAITTFAVIWFGVIAPLAGWYRQRAGELDQQRLILAHMRAGVDSLPYLAGQTQSIWPAEVNLLPGATNAVAGATLQEKVQSMAAASGASLSSVETLPTLSHGPYRQIGLRVAVTAPYPVLTKLLVEIGHGQPLMLIDDLQMRAGLVLNRTAATPVSATFDILAFRAAAAQASK